MINPFVKDNPEVEYEYYKERCLMLEERIRDVEDVLNKYAFLSEKNIIDWRACALWNEINEVII